MVVFVQGGRHADGRVQLLEDNPVPVLDPGKEVEEEGSVGGPEDGAEARASLGQGSNPIRLNAAFLQPHADFILLSSGKNIVYPEKLLKKFSCTKIVWLCVI